jgi:uroporphyrinogen-III synthase
MASVSSLSSVTDSSRVMVTRPEREARFWVDGLQARGVASEAFPLIEIVALPDPSALRQAWLAVPGHLAVMFVSANAVRFFMSARPVGASVETCRAWSTGPGTRAALLATGWPAELIDSPDESAMQFDSEALWALVEPRVKTAVQTAGWMDSDRDGVDSKARPGVLIVRGADAQGHMAGRDWLAVQMQAAGLHVQQTVAYMRQPPQLTPAQQSRARQAMGDGSRWLFSSSEAAVFLHQACPGLPLDRAKALATHPRIVQRLKQSGWSCVDLVPAALDAQALSIKSMA